MYSVWNKDTNKCVRENLPRKDAENIADALHEETLTTHIVWDDESEEDVYVSEDGF